MERTIKQAEELYGDIKDVRDELNILKSVAQYQETVQMRLRNCQKKTTDLSAAYIVNNVKELDVVADRIQSAQNEIANRQATLAGEQSKVLMVFTFATLLFTPNWAFFVIWLVAFFWEKIEESVIAVKESTMVSVLRALVCFFWGNIKEYGKKHAYMTHDLSSRLWRQDNGQRETDDLREASNFDDWELLKVKSP
ncbi:hypothetical protein COL516b_001283 [Colletotrichum fioriniae]|nr:uncharacterized protein COL516b_001283 [Colletotrichum fioriniae]KAJ0312211.1 hypothetical protein COL516b_001283 [Colletotrichum fioriniae]